MRWRKCDAHDESLSLPLSFALLRWSRYHRTFSEAGLEFWYTRSAHLDRPCIIPGVRCPR